MEFIPLTRTDGRTVFVRAREVRGLETTAFGAEPDGKTAEQVTVLDVGGNAYYVAEPLEVVLGLLEPEMVGV